MGPAGLNFSYSIASVTSRCRSPYLEAIGKSGFPSEAPAGFRICIRSGSSRRRRYRCLHLRSGIRIRLPKAGAAASAAAAAASASLASITATAAAASAASASSSAKGCHRLPQGGLRHCLLY